MDREEAETGALKLIKEKQKNNLIVGGVFGAKKGNVLVLFSPSKAHIWWWWYDTDGDYDDGDSDSNVMTMII